MNRVSNVLLFLLLAAVLVFDYVQYDAYRRYQAQVSADLRQLYSRVERLEARVEETSAQVEKLEKRSLGGMVDQANQAIIEGWSAMVEALQNELEKARRGAGEDAPPAPEGSNP